MEGIEQIGILEPATGIEAIDQQATLWMNSHYCPFGDAFWSFMSEIPVWIPLYVAIAALLVWRLGWKRGLVAIACIGLAFFLNERICNLIKDVVERLRPCNDPRMIAAGLHLIEEGGSWGFPSGHACNTFGLAISSIICLKMDKRHKWNWYAALIIVWATLVGISRIMMARHFLGDVLVGAAIGSLMGWLWGWIAEAICRKFIPASQSLCGI